MANHTPVKRLPRAGVLSLFLLVLLTPFASAQTPEVPTLPSLEDLERAPLAVALTTEEGFVQAKYPLGASTSFVIHDLSQDGGDPNRGAGAPVRPHIVDLRVVNFDEIQELGWQVQLGGSSLQMFAGLTERIEVNFVTTPQIKTREVTATILAELYDPTNSEMRVNATINLTGQVLPYSRPLARMLTFPQVAGQFERVKFEVLVSNDAVYHDVFEITATLDREGYEAVAPQTIYVPPLSTRTFNITVQTPKSGLYDWGTAGTLSVGIRSLNTGATGSAVGIIRSEGLYISSYWLPLLLVGMASAGVLVRDRRRNAELKRLEKGRARRVEPTPRQAVMLAALKREDPEAFKEQRARMDALYKARREKYREERKAIVIADKVERKQAQQEYKEATRAQKLQRKADRKQAKIDRKAARKQAKIDRKEAKQQAKLDKKERKRLGKELEKKRKQLDKARAKQAKLDAKEAKAQAKAAKAEERAARKAAKQSAKGRDGKP